MQLRVRKETHGADTINARQFEHWQSDLPIAQSEFILEANGRIKPAKDFTKSVAYDMAPLSSRTDKRDYRQAQPFVATGPSLAMNPYFDRYDPTRDPRNAVRELRGVVYEDKEADRGIVESQRMTARGYASRWMEGEEAEKEMKSALQAYDRMRPSFNDMSVDYRPGRVPAEAGPSGPAGPAGAWIAAGGSTRVVDTT